MKILLFAVSLLALVGCASGPRPVVYGLRFDADGGIVNSQGYDLNRVKLEGEMWTHGERINLLPFKIAYWPKGETITPQWRMSSVDRVTLYGRCDEGKLYLVFPHSGSATDYPSSDQAPLPRATSNRSNQPADPVTGYCQACRCHHFPADAHPAK